MFYHLVATAAVVAVVFGVVVLLVTTPELFSLLAQGALPFWRLMLALSTLLPMVFYLVGPIAAVIAVGYCYHQWSRHSEIVMLRSAGLSNRGLAVPGLAAAIVAMTFTASMSLYLLPVSFRSFEDINYAAGLALTIAALDEGYPQSIAPDLSISFRRRVAADYVEGVTVRDDRKADTRIFIIAERGHFVVRRQPETGAPEQIIVLEKGSYQERKSTTEHAKPVAFEDFVVPLARAGGPAKIRDWRGFFEEHIGRLLDPPPEIREVPIDYGQWIAEGHKRLLMPLLCLGYAAFALGVLLRGDNPRVGRVWRLLTLAAVTAFWHGLTVVIHSIIVQRPYLAPAYYLMAVIPAAAGAVLILASDRRARRRSVYRLPAAEPELS
jgi:lipopolysaccharide export system permease protein